MTPLILTIKVRTINGRANEIRRLQTCVALAKAQGRKVVIRVKARGLKV